MRKGKKSTINPEFFLNHPKNRSLEQLIKAVEIGVSFQRSENLEHPVANNLSQDQIWKNIYEKMPEEGVNLDRLLEEFYEKIMKNSINMNHPHYVGFPDIGTSSAAQVGNILAGLMNQNVINSETAAPTATFVTITVIQWLREILGYPVYKKPKGTQDVGGIGTVGGVLSIAISVLLARENAKKIHPGKDVAKFRILIPRGVSHYSVRRSAFWLGMSDQTTIEVDVDQNFCIIPQKLTKAIAGERKKGNISIAVVGYAGNSRTMSIDDFEAISKICKKHNLWFHVDACHGSSLAFSEKLKKKIKGIHLADSITIDPHKVLFVPYNLSYILVKDPSKMGLVAEIADICTTEPYSLGSMTPFLGSLAFNSLKLWFLIKHLGKKQIGKFIEERHELTRWFADQLKKEQDIVVLNEVMINSCAFYYLPKTEQKEINQGKIDKYNQINKKIFRTLFESGEYYVHSFPLNDEAGTISKKQKYALTCLRLMPGNPLTTKKILKTLIKEIKLVGERIYHDQK